MKKMILVLALIAVSEFLGIETSVINDGQAIAKAKAPQNLTIVDIPAAHKTTEEIGTPEAYSEPEAEMNNQEEKKAAQGPKQIIKNESKEQVTDTN